MTAHDSALRLAWDYIARHGRALEQARLAHHFSGESDEKTIEWELLKYQNADGGFGRCLEPDLRCPDSSVLATNIAIDLAIEYEWTNKSWFRDALNWLLAQLDSQTLTFEFIPPAAEDYPHAPWWNRADLHQNFDFFRCNPSLQSFGYLLRFMPEALANFNIHVLVDRVLALPEQTDVNTLLAIRALSQCQVLPQDLQLQVQEKLTQLTYASIATSKESWLTYGVKPLWVIHDKQDSAYAACSAAVSQNIQFEFDQQREDGSWNPNWTWGGQFEEDWPDALKDIKSILTLENLMTLKRWEAAS